MKKLAFDNNKYLKLQSQYIAERIEQFGGKLYLEFGGKLFDDYHAARVLPGFEPDSKLQMLLKLKDKAEIIIIVNADDIEKNKVRGDLGITYDLDVLRLIDCFKEIGLYVGSVVLTRYTNQVAANLFKNHLENLGVSVYTHGSIEGYPSNIAHIVSDEGFGKNAYIETTRELLIITAPGPGSGKMATCLSQLYHDSKHGIKSGYAKFETFPIWNLPLKHPINLAYEAATADLDDVNMIDPFHLEAYGKTAVNYNRDVEVFPILSAIFKEITGGESPYKSPTDMSVNVASNCIIDNDLCIYASNQEIIRRYYTALCDKKKGLIENNIVIKLEFLMKQSGLSKIDRPVISAACNKMKEYSEPASAIMLQNGKIVTGRTTELLGSSSAMLLNAVKELAGIDDSIHLIPPNVFEPIQQLKTESLGSKNPRLHTDETLIALSIAAATDDNAKKAMACLSELKDCEAHTSVIISQVDENIFKKLGINMTCEPQYQTDAFFHQ